MTLKKGDKVRVLKTLNGHTFATGEIVEIVHSLPAEAPDNYLGYVCKNERGEQSAVGADEIELYQARVPKVGDKVKIIGNANPYTSAEDYHYLTIGSEAVVEYVAGNVLGGNGHVKVAGLDVNGQPGIHQAILPIHFEFID